MSAKRCDILIKCFKERGAPITSYTGDADLGATTGLGILMRQSGGYMA